MNYKWYGRIEQEPVIMHHLLFLDSYFNSRFFRLAVWHDKKETLLQISVTVIQYPGNSTRDYSESSGKWRRLLAAL
jgi:hypothetical protein